MKESWCYECGSAPVVEKRSTITLTFAGDAATPSPRSPARSIWAPVDLARRRIWLTKDLLEASASSNGETLGLRYRWAYYSSLRLSFLDTAYSAGCLVRVRSVEGARTRPFSFSCSPELGCRSRAAPQTPHPKCLSWSASALLAPTLACDVCSALRRETRETVRLARWTPAGTVSMICRGKGRGAVRLDSISG